jgi:hypothetical protein
MHGGVNIKRTAMCNKYFEIKKTAMCTCDQAPLPRGSSMAEGGPVVQMYIVSGSFCVLACAHGDTPKTSCNNTTKPRALK